MSCAVVLIFTAGSGYVPPLNIRPEEDVGRYDHDPQWDSLTTTVAVLIILCVDQETEPR